MAGGLALAARLGAAPLAAGGLTGALMLGTICGAGLLLYAAAALLFGAMEREDLTTLRRRR
jgi:hypothetical protein